MCALFAKGTISRNHELQQELERYLKIRDGALRIFSIAQNSLQRLDAAKTLYVSNAQLLSCLRRVQREKVEEVRLANVTSNASPDKPEFTPDGTAVRSRRLARPGIARLCLSDIRIPLLWRDAPLGANMQMLMNRLFPPPTGLVGGLLTGAGDSADKTAGEDCENSYSVFCIVQVGNVIKDTRLIFDIKPGTTDIEFDDKLVFEDVTSDFRCILELYCYPRSSGKSGSMFTRRRTLTMDAARKMSDVDSSSTGGDAAQNALNYFELVARCAFTIKDVQDRSQAHTLDLGLKLSPFSRDTRESSIPSLTESFMHPVNGTSDSISLKTSQSSNGTTPTTPSVPHNSPYSLEQILLNQCPCDLPLFGNLCCRLVAQPHSTRKPLRTGLLWIRKLTASPSQEPARLYQCELRNRHLWAFLVDRETDQSNRSDKLEKAELVSAQTATVVTPNGETNSIWTGANGNRKRSSRMEGYPRIVEVDPSPHVSKDSDTNCPSDREQVSSQKEAAEEFQVPRSVPPKSAAKAQRLPDLVLPITPATLFLDVDPVKRLTEVTINRSSNPVDVVENDHPAVIAPDSTKVEPLKDHVVSNTWQSFDKLPCIHIVPHSTRAMKIKRKKQAREIYRSMQNILDTLEEPIRTTGGRMKWASVPDFRSTGVPLSEQSPQEPAVETNQSDTASLPHYGNSSSNLPETSTSAQWQVAYDIFNRAQPRAKSMTDLHNPLEHKVELIGTARSFESLLPTQTADSHSTAEESGLVEDPMDLPSSQLESNPDLIAHIPEPITMGKRQTDDYLENTPKELTLFTFRIGCNSLPVTRLSVGASPLTVPESSQCDTHNGCAELSMPSSEVYECAASRPSIRAYLRGAEDPKGNAGVLDKSPDLFADQESTSRWLNILRTHVEEQETWGADAFSGRLTIPVAAGTLFDASARRSLAFDSNRLVPTLPPLRCSPSLPSLAER
ncbi:unnamed protein product [Calicophoron daubneyi]|uniref:Anillin homology domain-containing protein n=1 Tax=Calicophoron daubneyi TaxID=300641 RepID=A0AAV2T771_CALDB